MSKALREIIDSLTTRGNKVDGLIQLRNPKVFVDSMSQEVAEDDEKVVETFGENEEHTGSEDGEDVVYDSVSNDGCINYMMNDEVFFGVLMN